MALTFLIVALVIAAVVGAWWLDCDAPELWDDDDPPLRRNGT